MNSRVIEQNQIIRRRRLRSEVVPSHRLTPRAACGSQPPVRAVSYRRRLRSRLGLLTAIRADGRHADLLTVPASTLEAEAETVMEPASPHYPSHVPPTDPRDTPDLLAALTAAPGGTDRAGTRNGSEDARVSEGGRPRRDLAAPWSVPGARPAVMRP
jgi:hypothetical protein